MCVRRRALCHRPESALQNPIFCNVHQFAMRPTTLALLLSLGLTTTATQAADELRAVTEDGRKVVLSADGRWRFSNNAPSPAAASSESPYQPRVGKFSVAFSTTDWNIAPKGEGEATNKRTFTHKTLPIYAMVISDEIPATPAMMREVILANARAAGASTSILLEQPQQVSGKEAGLLRFAAVLKGLEFVFSSLYYADGEGNIQVTCYTAQSLFFKYQADCQRFLNGLIIK